MGGQAMLERRSEFHILTAIGTKHYRHKALLVVPQTAAPFHIVTIRERVTKRDTLSMTLDGLDFLSLAKAMRAEDPGFLQPWYTGDAAMRVL